MELPNGDRRGRPSPESQTVGSAQRILQEATRLFASRGYNATSIQSIADAVGIRKQSLLHHFPSKSALREAVNEELILRWNGILPRLIRAIADPEGRLDAIVDTVLDFFGSDRDRARILVREALDRPQQLREFLARSSAPWLSIISAAIRRGQEEGRIHPDVDPQSFVVHMVHGIIGGLACLEATQVLLAPDSGDRPLERFRHELLRMAKDSLFIRSAAESDSD